jgi:hypothetical protein
VLLHRVESPARADAELDSGLLSMNITRDRYSDSRNCAGSSNCWQSNSMPQLSDDRRTTGAPVLPIDALREPLRVMIDLDVGRAAQWSACLDAARTACTGQA